METAIILLQVWFGGEALLVPMPDRQACVEATAEYPAGMATCWPPPIVPSARVTVPYQEPRIRGDRLPPW